VAYTPLKAEKLPSMGMTVPVTNLEAGDNNQNMAPSKSCGSPKRPINVAENHLSCPRTTFQARFNTVSA